MSRTQLWAVLKKELLDAIRDAPSVRALAIPALLGPAIFGGLVTLIADRETRTDFALPVAGIEHAPELVQWLEEQIGIDIVVAPDEPAQDVYDGTHSVVLVIGDGFGNSMLEGLPAPVVLINDSSKGESRRAAARVTDLLTRYGTEVASLRLTVRGIAPSIVTPLRVESVDLARPNQRATQILSYLPIAFLFIALTAAMPIAIDSTAGERERGSLEPLLLNPVSRRILIAGKWLAASCFGCAGAALFIISTLVVLNWIPWHDFGMRLELTDREILSIALVILPTSLLFAALMVFVSAMAGSLRQAQSFYGLVMLGVILLYMASVALPLSSVAWLVPIPVVGQFALTSEILAGRGPEAYLYALSAGGAIAVAIALLGCSGALLQRESIVYKT